MSGQQEIEVNGDRVVIPSECTLTCLMSLLDLQGRRVAIALNRSVVPRSRHATVTLSGGDHIEILEAVGGG